MFDGLTERLSSVFDRLGGRGVLSDKDIDEALREVRVALLEADVALPVVKDFISKAKERASGEAVIRSVKPADQVVKIVYDGLVEMLGGEEPTGLNLALNPPSVILMAGLQGSGKTTTTGKLALRLSKTERKKVLVASLDTRRPAAMEQLAMLAKQVEVDCLPIVAGQSAADIARRAMTAAKLGGHDVLILDTAGRTTLDEADDERGGGDRAASRQPTETLLVADSLTGQDAVRTAKAFHERLPLTGLVLTRADGDGRGGAALSMRHVTGLPIKFLGVSAKRSTPSTSSTPPGGRPHPRPGRHRRPRGSAPPQDLDHRRRPRRMAKSPGQGPVRPRHDLADQLARRCRSMGGMQGHDGPPAGVQKIEEADRRERQCRRTRRSSCVSQAIISSMTKAGAQASPTSFRPPASAASRPAPGST
jgi:signal recognition particle subunit SRP54